MGYCGKYAQNECCANPRSDGVLWEIRSEMDSHIDNVVEPTGVDMQAQEVCMQIV